MTKDKKPTVGMMKELLSKYPDDMLFIVLKKEDIQEGNQFKSFEFGLIDGKSMVIFQIDYVVF